MREAPDQGYKTNTSLRRIAEALGGSVESFFEANAEVHSLDEARELLSLWETLTKEGSRAEALRAVQAIAAGQPN